MKLKYLLLCLLPTLSHAADYYVSTTGNDTYTGRIGDPVQTITKGLKLLSTGDKLWINDGVYSGKVNFINQKSTPFPNDVTISAINPLSVTIQSINVPLAYYDSQVQLTGTHITVSGIIFNIEGSNYPPYQTVLNGDHNRLLKSIVRRSGKVDPFQDWVYVGGNYNLVEDVAGMGVARYGFEIGGPNSTASYNIFRRVIGRFDYSQSTQPRATFTTYGNNDGFGVHDVLYQNCIALDGQKGIDSPQPNYGAWYLPKNAAGVIIEGSIAYNNQVSYAGMFLKEQQGKDISLIDSIVWNNSSSVGVRIGGAGNNFNLNGVITDGTFANYSSGTVTTSNNKLVSNTAKVGYDIFNGGTKYKYGVSGTVWGEVGYNDLTKDNMFPMFMENKVKEVLALENSPPVGSTPLVNDTKRGWVSSQKSLFEYLGGKTLTTPVTTQPCTN